MNRSVFLHNVNNISCLCYAVLHDFDYRWLDLRSDRATRDTDMLGDSEDAASRSLPSCHLFGNVVAVDKSHLFSFLPLIDLQRSQLHLHCLFGTFCTPKHLPPGPTCSNK